jgi:hypothetical protein
MLSIRKDVLAKKAYDEVNMTNHIEIPDFGLELQTSRRLMNNYYMHSVVRIQPPEKSDEKRYRQ